MNNFSYQLNHLTPDENGESHNTLLVVDIVDKTINNFHSKTHSNFEEIAHAVAAQDREAYLKAIEGGAGAHIADALEELIPGFTIQDGTAFFKDFALPDNLVNFFLAADLDSNKVVRAASLFLNKLYQVPEESRGQVFDFIYHNLIQVNANGDLLLYKSVHPSGVKGHDFESRNSGYSVVDGMVYEDETSKFSFGSTVSMPRDMVDDNQNQACSHGLHVATWKYAAIIFHQLTRSELVNIAVIVDVRNIVSVPNDYSFQKLRVSEYRVLDKTITEPIEGVFNMEGYEGPQESESDTCDDLYDDEEEDDAANPIW